LADGWAEGNRFLRGRMSTAMGMGNKISEIRSLKNYIEFLSITKFEAFLVVFLICLYAVAEIGGIGMLMPILQYVSKGSEVYQSSDLGFVWKLIIRVTDFLRIPINLITLLILGFIPILLRQLFFYLQSSYSVKIQNRTILRLREECIGKILNADLGFFVRHSQGDLVSALTLEALRAGSSIMHILTLVSSVILLMVYTTLLFAIEGGLTIISITIFSSSFLASLPIIRISRKYGYELSSENINLVSV